MQEYKLFSPTDVSVEVFRFLYPQDRKYNSKRILDRIKEIHDVHDPKEKPSKVNNHHQNTNSQRIRNNLRKAKYKPRIILKVRYHALEHDAAAYACNFGQTVTPKA